jgi:hypothetical protein
MSHFLSLVHRYLHHILLELSAIAQLVEPILPHVLQLNRVLELVLHRYVRLELLFKLSFNW